MTVRASVRRRSRSASGTPLGSSANGFQKTLLSGASTMWVVIVLFEALQDDAGLDEAGAHPLAHVLHLLAAVGGEGPQAREIVLEVARRGEGHGVGQAGEAAVVAALRVQGHAPGPELELGEVVAQDPVEHVVVHAGARGEGAAIDRGQAFPGAPRERGAAAEVARSHGGQAIVVAPVADPGCEERFLPQPEFPVLVEDRLQGGGRLVGGVERRGDGEGQDERQEQGLGHGASGQPGTMVPRRLQFSAR